MYRFLESRMSRELGQKHRPPLSRSSGYTVWLRGWEAQIGRTRLYLLDSNDPANLPVHRGITSELCGGGAEVRLQQELILGIGGLRLLRALGIKPEVCHLNAREPSTGESTESNQIRFCRPS